ncbi:MAG: ATP-grasp domain-containing protein [Raoultibacter sp.]
MTHSEQGNRLLILGSMDEFVSLVEKAHKRGIYTVVCDGYPHGPARAFADESYVADPRDTRALCELCRTHELDAAISSFSDILFESLCTLTHAAGLESYCSLDAMACLRKKDLMKEMLRGIGAPLPRGCVLTRDFSESDVADMTFPCVMKPVDGYGSRGVFVVEDVVEIRERFSQTLAASAGALDAVVLEEYDTGHEFNMTTWVVDGMVHIIALADREKSEEIAGEVPHVSRIVYPSRFTAEVRPEALAIMQRVADAVGILDGPLCMQFFWHPARGIRVGEVVGRLFGYEHELVEYGSGLSLEDLLLDLLYDKPALRKRVVAHDLASFSKPCCGLYFHGHEGVVADLDRARTALDDPAVLESLFYYGEGDVVCHGAGSKPYVARAYIQAPSRADLDRVTKRIFREFQVLDATGKDLLYKNHVPKPSLDTESDGDPSDFSPAKKSLSEEGVRA